MPLWPLGKTLALNPLPGQLQKDTNLDAVRDANVGELGHGSGQFPDHHIVQLFDAL